jgi:hypothetical protein
MRIQSLPKSVRALPFRERQQALQEIVNAELHRHGICPVGQFMAGNRTFRVGVYYDTDSHYWYVTDNFDESHESLALGAIHASY